MSVDAYINYGRAVEVNTEPQNRAYLAPISAPDLQGLRMKSNFVQHDVFEATRDAPYLSCSDRYRRLESRQGM